MIKDYIKLGISNLFHRKMRSWLTMIGIFIGIAAIVGLISLGQGMKEAIGNVFLSIGSDGKSYWPDLFHKTLVGLSIIIFYFCDGFIQGVLSGLS